MKTKIRPLHDRLVVERKEEESQSPGGIFIPDSAKEKPIQATVVAVGLGKIQENGHVRNMTVKLGETVLIGKYAGTEFKIDGKEYVVIREDDIMGVIEN